MTLESLDFGNILQEATSASQEVYEIYPEQASITHLEQMKEIQLNTAQEQMKPISFVISWP